MKIAITCHPSQGGSGVVATETAEALVKRGHEVHLVATERPFRLSKDCDVNFHSVDIPNYPLFRCPPHDLSLANKLAEVTKKFNIDILHAHYAVPHSVTALLARDIVQPHHVRIVSTLHGTDITLVGSHKDFFDLVRYAMTRSDATTAVSEWLVRETMRRFDLPKPPVLIPNFVDPVRFNPEGRIPYPAPGEPFEFIHASNLRPVKRIADIIHVFCLVSQEVPARLTILGDGPEKGIAQELVAELGIGDRVRFGGQSHDMPNVLRRAHLYLLLSHYESFGLSALEAMACGTPVAGTLAGGLPEVVEDGVSGILSPIGETWETVRRIVGLISDRDAWEASSRAATQRALNWFSVDQVMPQYEALYTRVLNSPLAVGEH